MNQEQLTTARASSMFSWHSRNRKSILNFGQVSKFFILPYNRKLRCYHIKKPHDKLSITEIIDISHHYICVMASHLLHWKYPQKSAFFYRIICPYISTSPVPENFQQVYFRYTKYEYGVEVLGWRQEIWGGLHWNRYWHRTIQAVPCSIFWYVRTIVIEL